MPELSRFYGITIRLYLEEKEHNPPHVHAKYGSNAATVSVKNLVKKWILLHSEEIENIWETQEFRKIKPLE